VHDFHYHQGTLHAEQVPTTDIATQYGTPCYVFSQTAICRHWHAFDQAFGQQPHLVCYAVKANSNLSILHTLAQLGSGFDIVSVGELERVILAGGSPQKTVFSGVGKQAHEIQRALELNILCFNVESLNELHLINEIAGSLKTTAPISIRVNPNINVNTHPYIATGLHDNKFGIAYEQALEAYLIARDLPYLNVLGIDCHIGSQITEVAPFIEAITEVNTLIATLKTHDIHLQHIDIGGGLGVTYQDETPPSPATWVQEAIKALKSPDTTIIIEPGRSICANAGILLTQVLQLKETPSKHFAIVDAAMNDLIRPALYQAWHDILPVIEPSPKDSPITLDIVGPVCESGDFLGKDRPLAIQANQLLAITSAGAYCNTMTSNYNTRTKPAEIMVEKDQHRLIKPRETLAALLASEKNCLPD
jgi:diaminopimelate decarboxylase